MRAEPAFPLSPLSSNACSRSVSGWSVAHYVRLAKAWSSQKQNRWRMHAQQKPHPMQTKRRLGGAAKVQALQGFGRSSAKQSGRGIRKKENEGLLRACMHISWVQSVRVKTVTGAVQRSSACEWILCGQRGVYRATTGPACNLQKPSAGGTRCQLAVAPATAFKGWYNLASCVQLSGARAMHVWLTRLLAVGVAEAAVLSSPQQ